MRELRREHDPPHCAGPTIHIFLPGVPAAVTEWDDLQRNHSFLRCRVYRGRESTRGGRVSAGYAGWKVLVLDRNAAPGGCLLTSELTLPGFWHDFGAMNLGELVGSPFYAQHGETPRRRGVNFITAQKSYGSIFADGSLSRRMH